MFYFDKIYDQKILKSDFLSDCDVKHLFTTRESVVVPKDQQKLYSLCNDNFDKIANYLEIKKENIVIPIQTHSDNIGIARKGKFYTDTDALILDNTDVAVLMNFADCTPIILYDKVLNIGAIVHAGWKGTAKSILKKTIKLMNDIYKSEPKDITAIIGPAISMRNYEVDFDVFKSLKSSMNNDYDDYFIYNQTTKKYNVDLKTINKHQLEELGVLRIDKCDYCTYDSVDVFFSYRKELGKTARHSAILRLAK